MLTVLLALVLTGVTGEESPKGVQTYAAAYRQAETENRPLMVVIGAEWCPACVNLKHSTLASMEASGELNEVSVAVVDQDLEPDLARQLKRGEMIPQIVVFSKTDGGWKRSQLTGFQGTGTIRSMIQRAMSIIPGRS